MNVFKICSSFQRIGCSTVCTWSAHLIFNRQNLDKRNIVIYTIMQTVTADDLRHFLLEYRATVDTPEQRRGIWIHFHTIYAQPVGENLCKVRALTATCDPGHRGVSRRSMQKLPGLSACHLDARPVASIQDSMASLLPALGVLNSVISSPPASCCHTSGD